MRSLWRSLIFSLFLLVPLACQAATFTEGKDYTKLATPVPTATGNKVEVLEFFWYGCPHCYHFDPLITDWLKTLPDNAKFLRVPAPLNPRWMVHSKAYYALQSMGLGEKYHKAIFDAIHKDRKRLFTLDSLADFLASQGVDRKQFLETANSFAVEMQAKKAAQLGQEYHVTGVPMLAVNGKYTISVEQGGGFEGMLKIADYLIKLESKK